MVNAFSKSDTLWLEVLPSDRPLSCLILAMCAFASDGELTSIIDLEKSQSGRAKSSRSQGTSRTVYWPKIEIIV